MMKIGEVFWRFVVKNEDLTRSPLQDAAFDRRFPYVPLLTSCHPLLHYFKK
jgi:hypothetical protein